MSDPESGPEPAEDSLAAAAAAGDESARRRFFEVHPELATREFVGRLCDRATRLLQVDLEEADRFLAAAAWLAAELDDDEAKGRSLRAEGNVLATRRDYRGALVRYESALERFRSAGHQREVARTLSTAMVCLSHLGDFERARDWASEARRIYRELEEPLLLARLENNLGHILARQDRFHEALARYRAAYEHFHAAGQTEDAAIAMRNLAVCYQDLNDFPAALDAYRTAAEECERHGLPLLGLQVEFNIAYLHYLRGDYTRAIDLIEKSRRESEKHGDHHHRALCDLDQAEIYLELNLVEDAEKLAASAATGFRALGMQYETAKALTFTAIAHSRQGRAEKGLELLSRARQLFAAQENHVWVAASDLARARIYYLDGRFAEARTAARVALQVFLGTGPPTRIASCEVLLARLALAGGDSAGARDLCRRALDRLEPVGMPALEVQAHLVSGQAEESAGRREAALAAYRRSHAHLERLRSHLQTDDLKIAFTEDKRAVYESLVWLTVSEEGPEEDFERAFSFIEQAKSRSLSDLLAFRAQDLRPARRAPASVIEAVWTLRRELNSLYRQIDREEMRYDRRSRERIRRLRSLSDEKERLLVRSQRRLRSVDFESSTLQSSATAELDTIRASLPPGTDLIEYFIARDVVFGCHVDSDRIEIRRVSDVNTLHRLHQQLQLQLGKFLLGPARVAGSQALIHRSTMSALGRLYDELVAPLRSRLSGSRLVLVPHDFLHHLPFHALFDGSRFLVDDFTISYAPSATVFHLCSLRGGGAEDRALILGVPDDRAPRILDEVEAVRDALPNSRLLLGEEATPENLVQMGSNCRIVHLAAHGIFRRDNPMFSFIQLGSSRLSLFDLYNLDLDAELVVLSGCGTGLSAVRGADEQIGLTRGLLYAGARSLLVTLWDVNDASTARFTRLFYRQLQTAPHPADALRLAQIEHRRSFEHPYFWAPFMLVGGAPSRSGTASFPG